MYECVGCWGGGGVKFRDSPERQTRLPGLEEGSTDRSGAAAAMLAPQPGRDPELTNCT